MASPAASHKSAARAWRAAASARERQRHRPFALDVSATGSDDRCAMRSPLARLRARPSAAATTSTRHDLALAPTLVLMLRLTPGCGNESLDAVDHGTTTETTTGGTLPALDSGPLSTGEASTGEPPTSDDPRLCPAQCPLVLPLDWVYEGVAAAEPSPLGSHVITTMVREADGTLTLGEQREGTASLHRLDRHGALQWNVPLPLPCDTCELTDVALHPSGDLLLSASGWELDEGFSLFAARYDPIEHALRWVTSRPLNPVVGEQARSGNIAALSDELVVQLYMNAYSDFELQQNTRLVAYDADGLIVADEYLAQSSTDTARPPLLARVAPDEELVIGIFTGYDGNLAGRTHRLGPPLWTMVGSVPLPAALDDLEVDARGHALELGHTFDGTDAYLLLSDRTGLDVRPRWVATLALPSTSASTASLALGPDGDVYAAVRITQAATETATPLVGLTLARWTADGELRGSTSLLHAVAETFHPVALEIDDDHGLVIATVVDDRLRVERRSQRCECG